MTVKLRRSALSGTSIAALGLLFVALPLVYWLSFGPLIPERTFLLISTLDEINSQSDPSNIIYFFARPFLHSLLGWIFSDPLAFLIAGFISHSVFNGLIFSLAYLSIRRYCKEHAGLAVVAAAIFTALVYPLAMLAGVTGHGTTLIPHDAYHDFSFRTIFLILSTASFILLLNRSYIASLSFAALSCYVHPSAGILFLGLVLLALSPVLFGPKQIKLWFAVGLAFVVGMGPGISKLLMFELPAELSASMGYGEWYSQLIKDEADDFSALYQLIYYPLHTTRLMLGILGLLFIYAWLIGDYRKHRCFWYVAAIPLLFLLCAIAEYLFAVLYPGPLMYPIVALTPGYRLLSFAFFPMVVLAARLIHHVLMRAERAAAINRSNFLAGRFSPRQFTNIISITLVVMSGSLLIGMGVVSGKLASALSYGAWAVHSDKVQGIDEYLKAASESGADQYDEPDFYIIDGEPLTYSGERSLRKIRSLDSGQPGKRENDIVNKRFTVEAFVELIEQLRVNLPTDAALIVPPYLRYFRDALPDHPIFFQEHHDGNLMMGSPRFMQFWNDRMIELIGVTYEGLPSRYSGLSFSVIREKYLQLEQGKIESIYSRYPAYRFMVTEAEHKLAFKEIVTTEVYTVYDLSVRE